MSGHGAPDVMYQWNYPAYYGGIENLNRFPVNHGLNLPAVISQYGCQIITVHSRYPSKPVVDFSALFFPRLPVLLTGCPIKFFSCILA
jgi:hypothetical protein